MSEWFSLLPTGKHFQLGAISETSVQLLIDENRDQVSDDTVTFSVPTETGAGVQPAGVPELAAPAPPDLTITNQVVRSLSAATTSDEELQRQLDLARQIVLRYIVSP